MDFMFEDDVDEVGSDVEAYCPKCKADTTHVVISKYEDEIRRVQCNPCGDVHAFRKPRGEVEDDVPEPVSARKRATQKKLTWEEFFAKHGEKHGKPYEFREHYKENTIVNHPKFGRGFVSEIVSDSKAEITFKDARRVLVHNRKDIPGMPLAAAGDGQPTPPAPKGKKKDAAKAAPGPAAKAPEAKAEPKAEAKAEGKSETKTEAKSETKSEAKKDKADTKAAKTKPAAKVAAKAAPAKAPAKKPAAKAAKPAKPAAKKKK